MMYREFLVMKKAVIALTIIALIPSLIFAYAQLSLHGADRFSSPLSFALTTLIGWSLALFASIYGAAFAGTSREAARTLWVLPSARWRNAALAMMVDVASIFVACAILIAIMYVPELPFIGPAKIASMLANFDPHALLFALAFPFAVYGYSALVGMLLRRAPFAGVAVIPVGVIWTMLAQDPASSLLRALAPFNPVALMTHSAKAPGLQVKFSGFTVDRLGAALHWLTPNIAIAMLLVLGAAACAAAVGLWSRAQILA